MAKTTNSQPDPTPKHPVSRRLEYVRSHHGIPSRRQFWLRLGDKEADRDVVRWEAEGQEQSISYPAVKNYHYDKEPPVYYLARVAEVFADVRLEWLAAGNGEPTVQEEAAARAAAKAADPEAEPERAAIGEVFPWIRRGSQEENALLATYALLRGRLLSPMGSSADEQRLQDTEFARTVAEAVNAPLEALGLAGRSALSAGTVGDYIMLCTAAIDRLALEPVPLDSTALSHRSGEDDAEA